MKQLLITAAAAGVFGAPALATPTDALTLCALLGAAALGSSVINETASGKLSWGGSRAGSRGSYIGR
jgi:hypothetical protein